ncbi:hypothetical protein N8Z48_02085 [Algibacter sp.]|nr:hypothetical protein [bacterium]MDC1276928.1 hypothetical protein [Algibacter sp.]
MKIKVTKRQFKILLDKFHLIGDRGLELTMSGKLAKLITLNEVLNESRMYKVHLFIDALSTHIIIPSPNGAYARELVSKLYPNAQVHGAIEIKSKLC